MKKIMVVVGSVRQNRFADRVLPLVIEELKRHPQLEVDIADLKDIQLPFYNHEYSPSNPQFVYADAQTQDWAMRVEAADGFIFLTPEYNYSTSAVLKNAIDWVYGGWSHKPVAYVAWGVDKGVRAVESLRQIAAWPQMRPLRDATYIPAYAAFDADGKLIDKGIPKRIARTISQLEEILEK
jgi:NAD(P)H-dependent FMN reductase